MIKVRLVDDRQAVPKLSTHSERSTAAHEDGGPVGKESLFESLGTVLLLAHEEPDHSGNTIGGPCGHQR